MANAAPREVSSALVARQPGKPKKGEPYRMHVILPGELVIEMDALAEVMSAERSGLNITRTDIARMAIHQYAQTETARRLGVDHIKLAQERAAAAAQQFVDHLRSKK